MLRSPFKAKPLGTQKGFAVLIIASVVGAITLGFALNESIKLTKRFANYDITDTRKKIQKIQSRLEQVYRQNADDVDNPGSVIAWNDFNTWRTRGGFQGEFRLQGQVSNPIVDGEVTYRNIGVWIPGEEREPVFNLNTGTFSGCEDVREDSAACGFYAVIDGRTIQKERFEEARNKLARMAAIAESFASAKIRYNPNRPTGSSPFRPIANQSGTAGCDTRAPDELPCIDTFLNPDQIPASETETVRALLTRVLGISDQDLVDSWGRDIEVSTAFDNPANPRPPYTMQFRTVTPWGQEIRIYAFYRI